MAACDHPAPHAATHPHHRRLRRAASVVEGRHHRRRHRGRCRPPARTGLRHQLGCRGSRRSDHRCRRGPRRRDLRRVARTGLRPDGCDGRDPRAHRCGARDLVDRVGHRDGRDHRADRGSRRSRTSRHVHPLAGDRGVHTRHRRHHLSAAGSRRVRRGCPEGRTHPSGSHSRCHTRRLERCAADTRHRRRDRRADGRVAAHPSEHSRVIDRGHPRDRGRRVHTPRGASNRRTPLAPACTRTTAPRRRDHEIPCGSCCCHRCARGNRVAAVCAGRRNDVAVGTVRSRPRTHRPGTRVRGVGDVRRYARNRSDRADGGQRALGSTHTRVRDRALDLPARSGLPGDGPGLTDTAGCAVGRADGDLLPDGLVVDRPKDHAFHTIRRCDLRGDSSHHRLLRPHRGGADRDRRGSVLRTAAGREAVECDA